MEEYEKNLKEALKHLQIADHMIYVTFPIINEYRLLLKIFDEIYFSVINSIDAILNYEYLYKRIRIYSNNNDNLDTFFRIAKNYGISNEQIKKIREIINHNKKHKQSAIEFVKKDRVIIMNDNLSIQILDIITTKQYLLLAKELLMIIRKKFLVLS